MPAPKVTTSVEDQSTRISSVGTYNAAIVIAAKKGPINTPIKVSGQTDFLRRFTPNERIELGWDLAYYEAYQYLSQQSGLYVVRAAHTTDLATDDEDYVALYGGCVIKNSTAANANVSLTQGLTDPQLYDAQEDDAVLIYGSSEGAFNNDTSISIITDPEQVKLPGAFIINIYKNKVLVETKTCSLNPSLKNGYGVNCFVENVLTGSNYIRGLAFATEQTIYTVTAVAENEGTTYTYTGYTNTQGITSPQNLYSDAYLTKPLEYVKQVGDVILSYTLTYSEATEQYYPLPKAQSTLLPLACGNDGSAVTDADRITALKTLGNINDINIQLIMDGGNTTVAYQKAILDVCDRREDSCHGIISTPYENEQGQVTGDALTDLINYRKQELNANSQNLELFTPHQEIYDEFNDRNIYISPGPFVASNIMKYANELGWHWAVAGYTRGIVNSIDVAATYEPSIVDELSDAQINTIIKDPGYGNVIWDELTLLSQAQDLQDAHISRYVNIYLRPRLKDALKGFLFEFNDEETRELIVKMIDSFMQPQKASRAVYAWRTVCDDTNNLPSDIQNNILNCWLYIKPTKIAKWIRQKVIITPYSVDLESIEI